jgi:hypothetical protein
MRLLKTAKPSARWEIRRLYLVAPTVPFSWTASCGLSKPGSEASRLALHFRVSLPFKDGTLQSDRGSIATAWWRSIAESRRIDGVGSWADNVRASRYEAPHVHLQGSSKLASLSLHRPHSLWRSWALDGFTACASVLSKQEQGLAPNLKA